jgi:hypothetical protein
MYVIEFLSVRLLFDSGTTTGDDPDIGRLPSFSGSGRLLFIRPLEIESVAQQLQSYAGAAALAVG